MCCSASGVTITESALLASTKLSTRYISGRHLPDKAIDCLDEAAAQVGGVCVWVGGCEWGVCWRGEVGWGAGGRRGMLLNLCVVGTGTGTFCVLPSCICMPDVCPLVCRHSPLPPFPNSPPTHTTTTNRRMSRWRLSPAPPYTHASQLAFDFAIPLRACVCLLLNPTRYNTPNTQPPNIKAPPPKIPPQNPQTTTLTGQIPPP